VPACGEGVAALAVVAPAGVLEHAQSAMRANSVSVLIRRMSLLK